MTTLELEVQAPIQTPIQPWVSPVLNLLRGALHRLEVYGWTQGAAVDEHGRHCMVGAIEAEIRTVELNPNGGARDIYRSISSNDYEVYIKTRNLLDRLTGGCAIGFNDTRGRTKDQVMAVFQQAIDEVSSY